MGRWAVAAMLLGGCIAWGCSVSNAFTCAQDSQCGGDGVCQPTGGCSFPDEQCPSGQRYGDFAPDGLGGLCVDATSDTESGAATLDAGDATSTSTSTSTSGPSSLDDTGSPPETTTSAVESTGSTASPTTNSLTTGPPDTDVGDATTGVVGDPTLLLWLRFDDGLVDPVTNSGSFGEDVQCDEALSCPEFVPGVEGEAASFTGDAGLLIPHEDELSLPNEFTVAAWLQSGDLDSSPHSILAKAFGPGNFNSFNFVFTTAVDGDQADWEVALYLNTTSTADFVYADYDYAPDEWVHVTAVWDGSFASIYVGGTFFAAEPLPEPDFDGNPLTVGFDFNSGAAGQFYNGAVDDLRLYSRALDPDEIAELATP